MRNKYKFIGGFTISDKYEMLDLKRLASRGWILEDIVGGMFYKLKKDKPQTLYYNIDYNHNANEEYFDKFKSNGWNKVLSFKDTMHIFSSKEERKNVSSEKKLDRHITIQGIIKKQIMLWAIVNLIFIGLIAGSAYMYKLALLPLLFLELLPFMKLASETFQYYLYYEKIKAVKRYGNPKDSIANNKAYFTLNVFLGILFLAIGTFESLYDGKVKILWLFICALNVSSGVSQYKKYKKSLKSIAN